MKSRNLNIILYFLFLSLILVCKCYSIKKTDLYLKTSFNKKEIEKSKDNHKNINDKPNLFLGIYYSYYILKNVNTVSSGVHYKVYNKYPGIKLKVFTNKIFFRNYLNIIFQEIEFKNLRSKDDFLTGPDCPGYIFLKSKSFSIFYEFNIFNINRFQFAMNIGYNIVLSEMELIYSSKIDDYSRDYNVSPLYGINMNWYISKKIRFELSIFMIHINKMLGNYLYSGNWWLEEHSELFITFSVLFKL